MYSFIFYCMIIQNSAFRNLSRVSKEPEKTQPKKRHKNFCGIPLRLFTFYTILVLILKCDLHVDPRIVDLETEQYRLRHAIDYFANNYDNYYVNDDGELPVKDQQTRIKLLGLSRRLREIDILLEPFNSDHDTVGQRRARLKTGNQLRRLLLGEDDPIETVNGQTTDPDQASSRTGQFLKGLKQAKMTQNRFTFIPKRGLSRETAAGIKDLNLGKAGRSTIRFDRGLKSQPHINIDPRGFPHYKNPHIYVPKGIVSGFEAISKIATKVGPYLMYAAVAMDLYQMGSAINDDLNVQQNADSIIAEIEDTIELLRLASEDENIDEEERQAVLEEIEKFHKISAEVRLTKKNLEQNIPPKTVKTGAAIVGGWGGGLAAGWAGALAGGQCGTWAGALLGPAGMAVGAPIGAVVGGISAAIGGGMVGRSAGERVAEEVLTRVATDDQSEIMQEDYPKIAFGYISHLYITTLNLVVDKFN